MIRPLSPLFVAIATITACKQEVTVSSDVAVPAEAQAGVPHRVPPFGSIAPSGLAPHRKVTWLLSVISSPPDAMRTWEISELRAGDVPTSAAWPWKCRFGPVVIAKDSGEPSEQRPQTREVRCSNDDWATSAGDTAQFWPLQTPSSGNVETDVAGGERAFALVTLQPCISGCMSAPPLP
jgi:hypothetical protein